MSFSRPYTVVSLPRWHFLYFLPLPHQQGPFRPTGCALLRMVTGKTGFGGAGGGDSVCCCNSRNSAASAFIVALIATYSRYDSR